MLNCVHWTQIFVLRLTLPHCFWFTAHTGGSPHIHLPKVFRTFNETFTVIPFVDLMIWLKSNSAFHFNFLRRFEREIVDWPNTHKSYLLAMSWIKKSFRGWRQKFGINWIRFDFFFFLLKWKRKWTGCSVQRTNSPISDNNEKKNHMLWHEFSYHQVTRRNTLNFVELVSYFHYGPYDWTNSDMFECVRSIFVSLTTKQRQ